jgi:hypothetical protein
MSLKVTKENIFFLLPESRYAVSERIDAYMEKDFTVYVKAKLFAETLTQTESFLLARNGMHTGISAFKDSDDNNNVMFTYWFKDADDVPSPKQIFYTLGDDILNELGITAEWRIVKPSKDYDKRIEFYKQRLVKMSDDDRLKYFQSKKTQLKSNYTKSNFRSFNNFSADSLRLKNQGKY